MSAPKTSVKCAVCGEILVEQTEIPMLEHTHDWGEGAVTTEATCTEAGEKTYTCPICGQTRTEAIAALGHDIVQDAAREPSCTENGMTAGEHCTRCDYKTGMEAIPALGHDYTKRYSFDADFTVKITTFTCGRCGDSYSIEEVL